MARDRYLKLVLTVIAVALSVIALAQVDAPRAVTAAEVVEESSGNAAIQATSTLPLRWRIPFARHVNSATAGNMDCATVVSVVNFGPDDITVEVEFFDFSGASQGLTNRTQPTGNPDLHLTNNDVDIIPFALDASAATGLFDGYALVFADDPRIFVGAYLVCHEEGGSGDFPATVTNLSAFPVGQTLSYFRAGMPGMAPSPAVTEPES